MRKFFLALSAATMLAGAAWAQTEMEISLRPHGVETYQGTVLIGVDAAGRFLIALDDNGDGLADHCFLYTGKSRIEGGPWSELVTGATLQHAVGEGWASLVLSDLQGGLYLRLALDGAPLELAADNAFVRRIMHDGGWELVRVRPPAGATGPALATMSHGEPASWPASFWYDLLSEDSRVRCVLGSDRDCVAGGLNASQCSFVSSPDGPCSREGACSVTCASWPRNFACCGCQAFDTGGIIPDHGTRPECRCHLCLRLSEPDPQPRPGDPPLDPR